MNNERFIGLSPASRRCARVGLTAAGLTFLLSCLLPANAARVHAAGTVPLTGGRYTQDFNSLSNVAGGTTNTVSIPGWDLSESSDGARHNEQYAVDNGASTTGDTYSYGPVDSAERAFGGLGDDALSPTIGASFTNATGSPITSLDIAYTGEQWHLGTADRADRLDFQISTSATSLTTGTWTDVDALDFATPSTSSPTGQRDGNDAANRTSVSSSIGGLSIPNGATFWIRWAAFDAAGPDDGLAVDDFVLSPNADAAPVVSATDPADGATDVAPGGSVTITFDEPVRVTDGWFTIECATSGAHAATVSGGPTSFVLDPTSDFAAGEECAVTVVAAGVTDQDSDDPPENPTADHAFSFTIQRAAPAAPPIANDDTAATHEDTPIGIPVTANDTDVDGDLLPASVRIVVPPAAGSATVTANGTVRYTPAPNFHGHDRFGYRVCDAGGRCDRATVTVRVASLGDPPVANDDTAATHEDTPIGIPVTANDTDPDGDVDAVIVVSGPAHGRAVVVGRSIRYTPDPNFHGHDRFDYRVCDAGGRCDRARVTVSVASVADPPVASDVTVSTGEDRPVMIDVTGSAVDPDGDLDSVIVVSRPAHGRAVVVGRSIRYTPDPNFHGHDRFDYRICDAGGRCDRATVTVSVASAGDPPVANDDTAATHEDTPIGIPVTANDTDVDGDVDAVIVVSGPAHGRAVVVGRSIRYTPDPNFHGRDRFDYRVCDAGGRCDRATVTVSVASLGDPPVANDDTAATHEDTPIGIPVTANDTDPDGDVDAVIVVSGPAHGRAVVVGRSIRYTPDPNFHGRDHFDYRVCDVTSDCVTATVTLTIRPVGDAPTAVPDVVTVMWAGQVSIDVLANDTDVDGNADLDSTSVTIIAGPALGTASVNAVTGAIEYVAAPGTDGIDRLSYRVCDLGGRCATATLDIRLDVPATPTTTAPHPPGTLPTTGSNLGTPATAAAVAVVAAGALLLAGSRRRSLLRRRLSS